MIVQWIVSYINCYKKVQYIFLLRSIIILLTRKIHESYFQGLKNIMKWTSPNINWHYSDFQVVNCPSLREVNQISEHSHPGVLHHVTWVIQAHINNSDSLKFEASYNIMTWYVGWRPYLLFWCGSCRLGRIETVSLHYSVCNCIRRVKQFDRVAQIDV